MASVVHLAVRFAGSLRPGPPPSGDLAWMRDQLGDAEWGLFEQMNNPDQRHAVAVSRAVVEALPECGSDVVAAAALHDVGKVVSGFRTPGRVVATIVWAAVPDRVADRWLDAPRPLRTLAEYRRHPELGERLLAEAGASAVAAEWAADHHKQPERWRIDPRIGDVLKASDGD